MPEESGKSFEQIIELLERDHEYATTGILNGLKDFIASELKQGRSPKTALVIYKEKMRRHQQDTAKKM